MCFERMIAVHDGPEIESNTHLTLFLLQNEKNRGEYNFISSFTSASYFEVMKDSHAVRRNNTEKALYPSSICPSGNNLPNKNTISTIRKFTLK